jgi:signal peptidase I
LGARTGYTDRRETDGNPPPQKGVLRDYTETILVCVIFVIFTRAFAFQQSKIPSASMEDTLLVGDYIMVNRFVYSPASFGWERSILPQRELRRGDVVVFKYPSEPEIDYIKRVLGLPGDTVEVRDGHAYVNGARLDEPYVKASYRTPDNDFGPERVEPGHYFMMGDHRNKSSDSRAWGQVPRELIKGRALLIWWSYDEDPAGADATGVDQAKSVLHKLTHFVSGSRWSRCFSVIR